MISLAVAFCSWITGALKYRYSSLPPGPKSIRLLRLLPSEDAAADIKCQLFNYSLQLSERTHLYEALSYVWGKQEDAKSISIDGRLFMVRDNLHRALLRLRNHSVERVLWVDAICINQEDDKEKEGQIKHIATIYNQANRVIVWLGDATGDSNQAFEHIRIAAEDESRIPSSDEDSEKAVLSILARKWFRRIWVS